MTECLREALLALQSLTDEEQYILDKWFSSSSRNALRVAGIGDAEIGPQRKGIDSWPGDEYGDDYIEVALPVGELESEPLLRAVRSFRNLDDDELGAIASWFKFETREPLKRLGASEEEIGPPRSVPDHLD